ncbi:hypothetical protein Pmani_014725 [Petrolisthes manimaculis]|uniref:Uncharacterized protein n=1 Tax=Petrolisthes manimaculis TaxID=1843537 RepID=A0AAE1U831_9EUCA|nr:hypothetical protein Pmani_014725 [Petrolisthes manimaculis]
MSTQCWNKRRWSGGTRKSGGRGGGVVARGRVVAEEVEWWQWRWRGGRWTTGVLTGWRESHSVARSQGEGQVFSEVL